MKLVYIAGPFRAPTPYDVELNIRRAELLSVAVARTPGLFPVCPHTMGRFLSGAAPDEVWLEGDLEMLRRCNAVLLVPGWRRSSGTVAEVDLALGMDLPVFEATDDPDCPLDSPRAVAHSCRVAAIEMTPDRVGRCRATYGEGDLLEELSQ